VAWQRYVLEVGASSASGIKDFPGRKELVVKMSESGMSTRVIGAAIGVDQKTVVNDLGKGEENSSPQNKIDLVDKAKVPIGKLSKKYTDAYAAAVTEHPTWKPTHVQEWLNQKFAPLAFTTPDVTYLAMLADAPAEIRDAYTDGKISFLAVKAVLKHKWAHLTSDEMKVLIVRKAVAGLIGTGSAAWITKMMDIAGQVNANPAIKKVWFDPATESTMSYDDALDALVESKASSDKFVADEKQFIATHGPTMSVSLKVPELMAKLRATIEQVRQEMPMLVQLTFETDAVGQEMMDIGLELYEAGALVKNKGVPVDTAAQPTAGSTLADDGYGYQAEADGYAGVSTTGGQAGYYVDADPA
jgi:hypothetical protein